MGLGAMHQVVASLLVLGSLAGRGQLTPSVELPNVTRVSVKDPCEVASAADLKTLLSAGLAPYFPIKHSDDGEHVTISDPSITDASCPAFRIAVRTKIRYQKTRGLIQGSASGDMRFKSPLEVRIRHPYTIAAGTPLASGQVLSARACLTSIDVVELDLHNVPNWLDNGWVKNKLLDPKLNSACFDVTGLVQAYIKTGGVIKAS